MTSSIATGREITTVRTFDAPRELVWQAWTEGERLARWFGPFGFSLTTSVIDVRPGGRWEFVMHGPDGRNYPNEVAYEDVVRPERLVYNHGPAPKFQVTVTFVNEGGRTIVHQTQLFPSAADRDRVVRDFNAIEGAKQTFERLADFLANFEK